MKKVCVLKLGGRIAVQSKATSGGVGEAVAICNLLSYAGLKVEALTQMSKNDMFTDMFDIKDIRVIYDQIEDREYDALFVINGNVNFFGGQEDRAQILNYHVIQNFKGPVYYVMCDGAMTLNQIWPAIEKKPWASNWKKQDIEITRSVIYLTQGRNHEHLKIKTDKRGIPVERFTHFPFEKFPIMTLHGVQYGLVPYANREYDLSYPGTFRGGKRQDDMIKFYFDVPEDISTEFFGNIKLKQFSENKIEGKVAPDFNPSIAYNKFYQKMQKQLATCVIGDKDYKKLDNLAQRVYECIMCGVATFIDESYDFNRRVYKDSECADFFYVNSKEELISKIRTLKNDPVLFEQMIEKMQDTVIEDYREYCKSILKVL